MSTTTKPRTGGSRPTICPSCEHDPIGNPRVFANWLRRRLGWPELPHRCVEGGGDLAGPCGCTHACHQP